MTDVEGEPAPGPPPTTGEDSPPAEAPIERATQTPRATPLAIVPTGSPFRRPAKPAYGAGVDAWEAEAGQQGVVAITVPRPRLAVTLALAAAGALRDGVTISEVHLLPPHLLPASEHGSENLLLGRDQDIHMLEQELARTQRRAENARRSSDDSETEEDRRNFRRRADEHVRAAEELRRQIVELRAQPPDEVRLPALARTGPVVLALAQVANPEPAADLAETFAVQQIIRDLAMTLDGLLVRGTFTLAVPTKSQVLLLGPIPFALTNDCRNGVAVLLQHAAFTAGTMAPAFRTRAERQHLAARLRARPLSLSRRAADTALMAYFAAVPALLLGDPSDERADAWNDPAWADHLVTTYRRRGARRVSGPWFLFDPFRQALAYAVADSEQPLDRRAVIELMRRYGIGGAEGRVQQYTASPEQATAYTSRSWTWAPAVLRVPTGEGRAWTAALRRCPRCGGQAELVVRVPELPYNCMCPCGGAPGLPPTLRVPSSYVRLACTRDELATYETTRLALQEIESALLGLRNITSTQALTLPG